MRPLSRFLTLLVTGLSACAPAQKHALLPAEPAAAAPQREAPLRVGLAPVRVAGYLRVRELVVEDREGRPAPAQGHEWAEPIEPALERLLRDRISRALGFALAADASGDPGWELAVEVRVDRLHGGLGREAQIVAAWSLRPPAAGESRAEGRYADTAPVREEGYPGLIAAEVELLDRLAERIADAIRDQVEGRS